MPHSKHRQPTAETLTPEFREENKRFYREEEDYDWVAATDRIIGLESFFHRFRQRTILGLIRRYARPGRVLDAACGTGLFLRHLPAGSVGLDINPRNLARARRNAPGKELVLGDVEALPFPDASFSTVVLTEILEHVPDPSKMLAEVWRVLTPGGIIIGSTPRRSILWRLRSLSSTCPGEPFHREFSRTEIEQTLNGYGSAIISSHHLRMSWVFLLEKANHG